MGSSMDKEEKEFRTNYDMKDKLGEGNFSIVKRVVQKSDKKEFAVKIIKKEKLAEEEIESINSEVEILQTIRHKNCVQFYKIYRGKKKIFIVMEILGGGELFDRIVAKGTYTEKEASQAVKHIASGIHYLHSVGVVHRDLKPENLIYSDHSDTSPIKITDFGMAKFRSTNERLYTACGTPGYVAPEVLKRQDYGNEVDCWSLGVILYILLCGFPPFYNEVQSKLYEQIRKGDFDFPHPYWTEVTESAKGLIRKLLTVHPKQRYTAKNVLEHGWISGEEASSRPLGAKQIRGIKLVQARTKFRAALRAVIVLNRFARELMKIVERHSVTTTTTTTTTTTIGLT